MEAQIFHKNSFLSSSSNAGNAQDLLLFPMAVLSSCPRFSSVKANFQHQHSRDLNHEVFQAVISFYRLQTDF